MNRNKGVLETLRDLSPRHLEQFVADVWQERQGWTTEVQDSGRDRGVDVIGQPPGGGPKVAVQCKRYQDGNVIGAPKVREYAALTKQHSDVGGVTIVTTSGFTSEAERLSNPLDVKLIDGQTLIRIVDEFDAYDILEGMRMGNPGGQRMSSGDDDLRFGDITNSGHAGNQSLVGRLIELFLASLIGIVGLYIILKILESMVAFNIPFI